MPNYTVFEVYEQRKCWKRIHDDIDAATPEEAIDWAKAAADMGEGSMSEFGDDDYTESGWAVREGGDELFEAPMIVAGGLYDPTEADKAEEEALEDMRKREEPPQTTLAMAAPALLAACKKVFAFIECDLYENAEDDPWFIAAKTLQEAIETAEPKATA